MKTIAVTGVPNKRVMKEVMRRLGFSSAMIAHVNCLDRNQFPCYVTDARDLFHGQNELWIPCGVPKVHFKQFLKETKRGKIWEKLERI